ncbi:MAG: hypothetical protein ACRDQD_13770 [Nocardioidaceae bacterium]
MATEEIPLYDVTAALGDASKYRVTAGRGTVAAHTVVIADQLAYHLGRHFPDRDEARVAGHALVIAAASLGALPDLPVAVVCNIAGLAGQSLVMGASGVDGG